MLKETLDDGTAVFVRSAEQEIGPDALVAGELVSIAGQCVGLSDGVRESVLVFEYGTSIGDGNSIVVPNGGTFALGDRIQGSGAYAELNGVAEGSDIAVALRDQAPACYAAGTVASIASVEAAS